MKTYMVIKHCRLSIWEEYPPEYIALSDDKPAPAFKEDGIYYYTYHLVTNRKEG